MKIAVYGKLRAGKSAVCDYIANKYDCEILEFIGAVQEVIDVIYPEKKGVKDRETLVSVGQHMRKLDKDVWVKVIRNKIKSSKANNILVAGVRQQNEYDMLKELGFTFIQVEASETTRVERCVEAGDKFDKEYLRNPTELVMDEWKPDYLILNEYGFKELEISINNILADMDSKALRKAFFTEELKKFYERTKVK